MAAHGSEIFNPTGNCFNENHIVEVKTPETSPPIPPRCRSALNTVQTFCGQKLSSWMVRNASYLRRRELHAMRCRLRLHIEGLTVI